ncbi:hypothetical protein WER97_06050 [Staphylococcus felis]|uniref:Uncharacterized protein n=1 Tax=Staphylococcus felis TaxID=46127 RepID=A0ABS0QPZ0_9STAP|nr:hypothetical protein [Staphylococcus felis]MBH9581237.1 hypothetical protein [Staphylococcus felis]
MKKEEFKNYYLDPHSQEFNKELNEIIQIFCQTNIDELNHKRLQYIDRLINKSKGLEPSMLNYSSITAMTFNFDDENGQLNEIGQFLRSALNEHFDCNFKDEDINENGCLANQYKVVKKSIEHLDLAINQKQSLYNEQDKELNKVKRIIITFNEKIRNSENRLERIYKNKNQIYTEFVAILGIFASIIFGVFGGFQEIQLIGKNLNTTPIPKLLIFSSLVMLGITLIIFLCFNAISKLTNLSLKSCDCEASKCNCSFRKKHPTIFYSSCVYLYVLCVGFALRLYKYTDFTVKDILNEWDDLLPFFLILLPIIIFFAYILYDKYSNNTKKQK